MLSMRPNANSHHEFIGTTSFHLSWVRLWMIRLVSFLHSLDIYVGGGSLISLVVETVDGISVAEPGLG